MNKAPNLHKFREITKLVEMSKLLIELSYGKRNLIELKEKINLQNKSLLDLIKECELLGFIAYAGGKKTKTKDYCLTKQGTNLSVVLKEALNIISAKFPAVFMREKHFCSTCRTTLPGMVQTRKDGFTTFTCDLCHEQIEMGIMEYIPANKILDEKNKDVKLFKKQIKKSSLRLKEKK